MSKIERLTADDEWNYILSESNNVAKGYTGYAYNPCLLSKIRERLDSKNVEYNIREEEDYWIIEPKNKVRKGGRPKCQKGMQEQK